MRKRRRRAPVVGFAVRSGEVKGRTGALEAAGPGDRRKSSDQPDCFSSGKSRARSPTAGHEKPKAAGWPLSRALQMGDDRRCSCSSSATVAMRCSSRPGKTRGFVETLVGSASIGAGKRPGTRPGRRPNSGRRAHRLSAEVAPAKCLSRYERFLADRRPPPGPIALIRAATLAPGGPFPSTGLPPPPGQNPNGGLWPLRAAAGVAGRFGERVKSTRSIPSRFVLGTGGVHQIADVAGTRRLRQWRSFTHGVGTLRKLLQAKSPE